MKTRQKLIEMVQWLDYYLQPMSEKEPSPIALAEILRDLMVAIVEELGSNDDVTALANSRRTRRRR